MPQDRPLPGFPIWLGAGRVDGDALDDLIVAHSVSRVAVLLSRGDGTFREAQSVAAPQFPTDLELADLDGDGHMDIVIAGSHDGKVAVTFGDGTRNFFGAQEFQGAPYDWTKLEAEDFFQRGGRDVVSSSPGIIRVLRTKADRSLELVRSCASLREIADLEVADLDADGAFDLVVADRQGWILVIRRSDAEDFDATPIVLTGGKARSVVVDDSTGDGIRDLAAVDGTRRLSLVRGFGGNSFAPPSGFDLPHVGYFVGRLDFDGDGRPDLAVWADTRLSILHGLGDGTFEISGSAGVPDSRSPTIAELDGDGVADVAVLASESPSIVIRPVGRDGRVLDPVLISTALGMSLLRVADMDGDALLDIVVGGMTGEIYLHRARGHGRFGPPEPVSARRPEALTWLEPVVLPARLASDLVARTNRSVFLLRNRGDGTFEDERMILPVETSAVGLADMNFDNLLDLVFIVGELLSVLEGRPDGTFGEPSRYFHVGYGFSALVLADVDADGRTDAAVALDPPYARGFPGIALLSNRTISPAAPDCNRNGIPDTCDVRDGSSAGADGDGIPDECETDCDGNGIPDLTEILAGQAPDRNGNRRIDACDLAVPVLAFSTPHRMETGAMGSWILSGDVDRDGLADLPLFQSRKEGTALEVLLNRALGRWERLPEIKVGTDLRSHRLADLDRDGIPDLVVISGGRVLVSIGAGDGTFGRFRSFPVAGAFPRGIAVLDAGRDGKLDIAVADFANGSAGGISILKGRGDGSFEAPLGMPAGKGPWGIASVDFDRDGAPDLAVASKVPSGILLFENRTQVPRDTDCDGNGIPDRCDVASGALLDRNENGTADVCEEGCRIPGDCNGDRRLDVSDCICLLGFLFLGDPAVLPCGDGASSYPANLRLLDWEEDGALAIADAISVLRFLFLGGPAHSMAVPGQEARACVFFEGC